MPSAPKYQWAGLVRASNIARNAASGVGSAIRSGIRTITPTNFSLNPTTFVYPFSSGIGQYLNPVGIGEDLMKGTKRGSEFYDFLTKVQNERKLYENLDARNQAIVPNIFSEAGFPKETAYLTDLGFINANKPLYADAIDKYTGIGNLMMNVAFDDGTFPDGQSRVSIPQSYLIDAKGVATNLDNFISSGIGGKTTRPMALYRKSADEVKRVLNIKDKSITLKRLSDLKPGDIILETNFVSYFDVNRPLFNANSYLPPYKTNSFLQETEFPSGVSFGVPTFHSNDLSFLDEAEFIGNRFGLRKFTGRNPAGTLNFDYMGGFKDGGTTSTAPKYQWAGLVRASNIARNAASGVGSAIRSAIRTIPVTNFSFNPIKFSYPFSSGIGQYLRPVGMGEDIIKGVKRGSEFYDFLNKVQNERRLYQNLDARNQAIVPYNFKFGENPSAETAYLTDLGFINANKPLYARAIDIYTGIGNRTINTAFDDGKFPDGRSTTFLPGQGLSNQFKRTQTILNSKKQASNLDDFISSGIGGKTTRPLTLFRKSSDESKFVLNKDKSITVKKLSDLKPGDIILETNFVSYFDVNRPYYNDYEGIPPYKDNLFMQQTAFPSGVSFAVPSFHTKAGAFPWEVETIGNRFGLRKFTGKDSDGFLNFDYMGGFQNGGTTPKYQLAGLARAGRTGRQLSLFPKVVKPLVNPITTTQNLGKQLSFNFNAPSVAVQTYNQPLTFNAPDLSNIPGARDFSFLMEAPIDSDFGKFKQKLYDFRTSNFKPLGDPEYLNFMVNKQPNSLGRYSDYDIPREFNYLTELGLRDYNTPAGQVALEDYAKRRSKLYNTIFTDFKYSPDGTTMYMKSPEDFRRPLDVTDPRYQAVLQQLRERVNALDLSFDPNIVGKTSSPLILHRGTRGDMVNVVDPSDFSIKLKRLSEVGDDEIFFSTGFTSTFNPAMPTFWPPTVQKAFGRNDHLRIYNPSGSTVLSPALHMTDIQWPGEGEILLPRFSFFQKAKSFPLKASNLESSNEISGGAFDFNPPTTDLINLGFIRQQGGTVRRYQDVEKLGELEPPTNTDAQNFPKREIPDEVKSNINPDLLYFNPGQAFFENNPEEGLDRQKDWLTTYIQSPMYLERLSKEFPNYSQSELEAERDTRLNNVLTTKIRYPDEPLGGSFGYTAGLYYMKEAPENVMVRTSEGMVPQTGSGSSRGRIELEPEYRPEGMPRIAGAFQYPYPGFELIPLHELGHSVDDGGTRIPATTRNLIYENVIAPNQYNVNESYPEDNQEFTYVGSPSEFVNRLLPFRYELQRLNIVDPNTQQITEYHIRKYLELTNFEGGSFKNSQVEDLFNNVKGEGNTEQERLDDQIKRIAFMLNNIAMNESQQMFYGQGGGIIGNQRAYLEGMKVDPMKYKPVVGDRKGVRKNPNGRESSHLMAYAKADKLGGYVVFPTLFQNEQGEFYEPQDPVAEAIKKNEIYRFGNDLKSAKAFAAGSWKRKAGGKITKHQQTTTPNFVSLRDTPKATSGNRRRRLKSTINPFAV